jgi:hypothetical protein
MALELKLKLMHKILFKKDTKEYNQNLKALLKKEYYKVVFNY